MAFNNANCPCGASVYSFDTNDGIENEKCQFCLQQEKLFDNPPPPPPPPTISFKALWVGREPLDGEITEAPTQKEIDECHTLGWHPELVSITVESETMTFDGEFVTRNDGKLVRWSPTQMSEFTFGRALIEAQRIRNKWLGY